MKGHLALNRAAKAVGMKGVRRRSGLLCSQLPAGKRVYAGLASMISNLHVP